MKEIQLAVFDMAGTTVDEGNVVYKTVQKVINEIGFPVSLDEVLKYGAGKEKHKAIIDVLEACTIAENIEEKANEAFALFKPAMEIAYDECEIKSFEGMDVFFDRLKNKGIHVVLNTGYDFKTATKLMNRLQWQVGKQVDSLITSDDVENGRPHPDMIFKAMKQFNISATTLVLKAGDSEIDILEGKNAGCGVTVGVLSGAQSREQLASASPDYILNYVTELMTIIS